MCSAEPPNLRIGAQMEPGPDFEAMVGHDIWVHIGLTYLSTWQPTFAALNKSDELSVVEGGVPLRHSGDFHTFYKYMDTLDKDRAWFLCIYHLGESEQALGAFVPAEVVAFRVGLPTLFWKGSGFKRQRPANAKARNPAASPPAAEALQDWGQLAMEEVGSGASSSSNSDIIAALSDVSAQEEDLLGDEIEDWLMDAIVEGGDAAEEVVPSGEQAGGDGQPGNVKPVQAPPLLAEPLGPQAGSSSDPAPVQPAPGAPAVLGAAAAPPMPPPAQRVVAAGPRGSGLCRVIMLQGTIDMYADKKDELKGRFQATCGNAAHGGPVPPYKGQPCSVSGEQQCARPPLGLDAGMAPSISGLPGRRRALGDGGVLDLRRSGRRPQRAVIGALRRGARQL